MNRNVVLVQVLRKMYNYDKMSLDRTRENESSLLPLVNKKEFSIQRVSGYELYLPHIASALR